MKEKSQLSEEDKLQIQLFQIRNNIDVLNNRIKQLVEAYNNGLTRLEALRKEEVKDEGNTDSGK